MITLPRSLLGRSLCSLVAVATFALGCATQPGQVELTVSDHNPTGSVPALAVDHWADQVTQRTGGKLRLAVYHDGTVLQANQAYQGLQSGIADVAYYVLDRTDGFALNSVMELPFMGWPDPTKAAQIYQELLGSNAAMQAEWKGLKVIAMAMTPGTHLHNVVRDIRAPADLSGLKTMATEALAADSARAAGAVALELEVARMAAVLTDGTVKALISDFSTMSVFGALDAVDHHTVFGDAGINLRPALVVMNADVFNSLSADVQAVLATSSSVFVDELSALATLQADAIAQAGAAGHSIVQLTPDEIAVWSNLIKQPVHNTWIASSAAAGLPAQALYDDVVQRIQTATSAP